MISNKSIEAELGISTMLTERMQTAIQDWYDAAINGEPLNHDKDTLSAGWPAAISQELARLTTLELVAKVEGSDRAEWVNRKLQQTLNPRRIRKFSLALALGSGVWKPYQAGDRIGVVFIPATGYYPISVDVDDNLTEAVFVDQLQDSDNYYNRIEWMHVLNGPEDYHDSERDILEREDLDAAGEYPCVQVINLAFRSSSRDELGSRIRLDARPEWEDIQPVAYLNGADTIKVGYFVCPNINPVEPTSDLGAPVWVLATQAIIDADEQFTRLDWEYEGGELAVNVDKQYLQPIKPPVWLADDDAKRGYGVPAKDLDSKAAAHRGRLFQGLDINTGITQQTPFYQIFAPSLRDGSYLSGLNLYVRRIEERCGLSYGTFSAVTDTEKTATEIISSKQKLYSTVSALQAALEEALRGLIDALDFWADTVPDAPPRGEMNVSFQWDDSIIIDRLTEKAQWQAEVNMGLRSRTEYRQHFFGEDEQTAADAVAATMHEAMQPEMLRGVIESGQP